MIYYETYLGISLCVARIGRTYKGVEGWEGQSGTNKHLNPLVICLVLPALRHVVPVLCEAGSDVAFMTRQALQSGSTI